MLVQKGEGGLQAASIIVQSNGYTNALLLAYGDMGLSKAGFPFAYGIVMGLRYNIRIIRSERMNIYFFLNVKMKCTRCVMSAV